MLDDIYAPPEDCPKDITRSIRYLNELADKTMRPELYEIADKLYIAAKDRDYWRTEHSDFINQSIHNSKKMTGEILKVLVNKVGV